jgi:hypothetical protein
MKKVAEQTLGAKSLTRRENDADPARNLAEMEY